MELAELRGRARTFYMGGGAEDFGRQILLLKMCVSKHFYGASKGYSWIYYLTLLKF